MDKRVWCQVMDEGVPVKGATAFRLVEEVGNEFFLDFLAPCSEGSQLEVVSRVRMQREALQAVRDRLSTDVVEIPLTGVVN